jgi:hypothetical protein
MGAFSYERFGSPGRINCPRDDFCLAGALMDRPFVSIKGQHEACAEGAWRTRYCGAAHNAGYGRRRVLDVVALRRFPPSWSIEEHNAARFIVRNKSGPALALFHF